MMKKTILLWPLILAYFLILIYSESISIEVKTIFLFCWMMIWWISEFIPMGIVALLPIVYFPTVGVLNLKTVASSYSDPILFLFLGGFVLARALEKTDLSQLFAINLLRKTGTSTLGVQLCFLISTSFISMWISNTSTTMMMVPIALAVIQKIKSFDISNEDSLGKIKKFQTGLMLIVSYSASLGGLMTPIGTPPNLVFSGILKRLYGMEIDFLTWMLLTAPVGIACLAALFLVIKYGPLKSNLHFSQALIKSIHQVDQNVRRKLNTEQMLTLGIFILIVFLWIFKSPINHLIGKNLLDDSITAVIGAILLFCIPFFDHQKKEHRFILDSKDINKLPWDVFLLFGGSMALASGLESSGLLNQLVNKFQQMGNFPLILSMLILTALIVFLTEVMSNVALAAVALPIILGWAKAHGYSLEIMGLMVALATSFGFSLPMSTPPNAIVFGTGEIRFKEMLVNGWIMNLATIVILVLGAYFWWPILLNP